MKPIEIDGAFGEGGGQIIRSAVTLSCLTQKPVEITNIRKNRKVPGLRAQHMTAIKIIAKVCNAKVEGLHVGSTEIKFFPSNVIDTNLKEDVGTAGSIPLILQVLIPAVAISKKKLKMTITGGTDVLWSPTSDYTRFVLREAYSRMGINFSIDIKRRGYYPRGGGIVDVNIFPCEKLKPISLLKRTSKSVKITCSHSMISPEIMEKEITKAKEILEKYGFDCQYEIKNELAYDVGCSFLAYAHDESSVNGSDSIYNKGVEGIGQSIAKRFLESEFGVDQFRSEEHTSEL